MAIVNLGKTSIGATNGSLSGNNEFAFGPYTASESGVIESIHVYYGSIGGGARARYGVYLDSAGTPGALVAAQTAEVVSSSPGWNSATASGSIVAGQSYWIGEITNTNHQHQYDAGTKAVRIKAKTYASGLSDPWPAGDSTTSSRDYSAYITYSTELIIITSPVAGSGMVDETTRGGSQSENVISITGTASGFTGPIEARFNGGSWSTIATVTGDGAWSGAISNVAAGRGSIEVREVADTGNSNSVANFGVGFVFILTGDSNAEGRLDNSQTHGLGSNVPYVFNESAQWVEMTNNISYWVKMAALITTRTSKPCTFVWHATGSQDFALRGSAGAQAYNTAGASYAALVALITGSGVTSFNGVLCSFGPNAAGVTGPVLTEDEYIAAITSFRDGLRTETGQADLPMYLGVFGSSSATTSGNPGVRNGIAKAVRRGIIQAGPNVINQDWSDGVHPSTDAEGAFISGSWDAILSGVKPPRITSAIKADQGASVKLRFNQDLDDSVTDYDTDLFVLDSGTITAAEQTDTREITLSVEGGEDNVGFETDGVSSGNLSSQLWAFGPWTMPEAGFLQSISMRDALASTLTLALYEDNAGSPGVLVANYGSAGAAVSNWRTASGTPVLLESGHLYWIAARNVGAAMDPRYTAEVGKSAVFQAAGGSIPDPFGSVTVVASRKYSAFFTYASISSPTEISLLPNETALGANVPIGTLYTLPVEIAGVTEVYQVIDPVDSFRLGSNSGFGEGSGVTRRITRPITRGITRRI